MMIWHKLTTQLAIIRRLLKCLNNFTVTFSSVIVQLNVTWSDRRLTFLNLKGDVYDNALTSDTAAAIWIPDIGKQIELSGGCIAKR